MDLDGLLQVLDASSVSGFPATQQLLLDEKKVSAMEETGGRTQSTQSNT